jgi:cell division protease FtsH
MTTFGIFGIGWYEFQGYVLTWGPLILMGFLVFLIWKTLRLMPRTKPQEITPRSKSAVEWEEVAGIDETKDELREVVEFLTDPKRFKRLGATVPKGILLHGPPGTGKTLLAKAVAHESGATFFSQSASSFIEMFAGLGAARIRRLFKEARDNAPAIVFIDELDAVGAHRGSDISGERDQTLNQLLVEMDGFDARDQVVVMAASNLLEKLDKALLRPGRFDRQVFVPPPDMAGRHDILRVHTRGKPIGEGVDLERVARHTAGLTGADLANLANEAAILAGRSHRDFITQADFDNAFERVVAGLATRKVITPQEKRVVAWHEAGHAVVSELLPTVDKVQKVSIVPRGKALGYTLNLPQEDRYLKSREELIDYMKVLLAGRVSEQICFGRITTGAADDLSRVTKIARSMVYEYAMGTQIHAHQLAEDDAGASDATRQTRDEEVQAIAEEAYRGAHRLLVDHRDLLDEVAELLLEQETIERDEIQSIMACHRNGSPADPEDAEAPTAEQVLTPAGQPAAALATKPGNRRFKPPGV